MFGVYLILGVVMAMITITRFFMSVFSRSNYFIFLLYAAISGALLYKAYDVKGAPLVWQDFPEVALGYLAQMLNPAHIIQFIS